MLDTLIQQALYRVAFLAVLFFLPVSTPRVAFYAVSRKLASAHASTRPSCRQWHVGEAWSSCCSIPIPRRSFPPYLWYPDAARTEALFLPDGLRRLAWMIVFFYSLLPFLRFLLFILSAIYRETCIYLYHYRLE